MYAVLRMRGILASGMYRIWRETSFGSQQPPQQHGSRPSRSALQRPAAGGSPRGGPATAPSRAAPTAPSPGKLTPSNRAAGYIILLTFGPRFQTKCRLQYSVLWPYTPKFEEGAGVARRREERRLWPGESAVRLPTVIVPTGSLVSL